MSAAIRSPLADYHLSQGATLTEHRGAVVPARFSDPVLEHQAVRKAAGLFDFSFRAKFALKGEDRVSFLQGMVTNDVQKLKPGEGAYAVLLNALGHILADARIYRLEQSFLIDTDADLRDKVMKVFDHHIIMDQVEQEHLELFTLAFQGPRARPL